VEWVETTGRTIDEAKERALDELGVDDQDAEFEVVEEPKAGLFGIVRREARVRARVRPTRPRPKQERRRQPKGGRSRTSGGSKRRDDESGDVKASPETSSETGSESASDGNDVRPGGRPPRSRSGGGAKKAPAKRAEGQRQNRVDSNEGKDMDEVTIDQQVEVMEEFLDGLVEAFGLDGRITTESVDEDIVEIRIEGDDLGLMIGPKGQTLAAVQELARAVAQRKLAGRHQGRVRLDVGGYRQRRAEALSRFARQVADDVLATGLEKALEPMSPPDRKVVHDTINDIDGVRTISEGEDNRRRVVILPDA
jgi:spoIIIJ-associated protein